MLADFSQQFEKKWCEWKLQKFPFKTNIFKRPRCDHGDLRNPPDHRMVAKYQKKTLLCVTATGTVLRSHGALTRKLCEPNCASTMTSASVRRSYHDLTAPWTRAQCDHRWPYSDVTTTYATALRCLDAPSRLLRTYDVRTTILRRPSAFRCIFGSIPLQARMFSTHFF